MKSKRKNLKNKKKLINSNATSPKKRVKETLKERLNNTKTLDDLSK